MKYFYPYKVEDRFWVYDRYSNKITEVDELTYKIIASYSKHHFDEEKVTRYLKDLADKEDLAEKTRDIKHYQKEYDIFKPFNLYRCIMPVTDRDLEIKYENEIHHFIYNLTKDCNLRCKYCKFGGTYVGVKTHNTNSMSYDIIDESINLIKQYYKKKETLFIAFYGGEPLMEFKKMKYIVKKIKYFYDNVSFSFTTNGTLLNKKIIEFLIKNDFLLMISLDGSKDIHNNNRVTKNGRETFDIIIKRINEIKENNIRYYNRNVGFVVTIAPPYNLIEIINFFEKNTNINQRLFVSAVEPFGTSYFDNFNMKIQNKKLRKQYKELIEEYIILKTKNIYNLRTKILNDFFGIALLELDDRYIFPLESSQIPPNGACFPGLKSLFINIDGKLGMCEKVNDQITFGDVKNGININKVKYIYKNYCGLVDKMCLNCWAYRLCKSCYIESISDGRNSLKRKLEYCHIKKEEIINNLETYTRIKMHNSDAFM